MVSAVKEIETAVKAMKYGAYDYIVKPCGQLELMARIKARIRDRDNYGEESPLYYAAPPTA